MPKAPRDIETLITNNLLKLKTLQNSPSPSTEPQVGKIPISQLVLEEMHARAQPGAGEAGERRQVRAGPGAEGGRADSRDGAAAEEGGGQAEPSTKRAAPPVPPAPKRAAKSPAQPRPPQPPIYSQINVGCCRRGEEAGAAAALPTAAAAGLTRRRRTTSERSRSWPTCTAGRALAHHLHPYDTPGREGRKRGDPDQRGPRDLVQGRRRRPDPQPDLRL